MPAPSSLLCLACGAIARLDGAQHCEHCFGPVAFSVEWESLGSSLDRAAIEGGPTCMRRYAELLPVPIADTGVGWTPFARAEALGAALGLDDLWLKDETANPTGSFKDRVVATALARAGDLGLTTAACASTGNLARALAAGASRAGMAAIVLVPESLDEGSVGAITALGASVVAVRGGYDAANRLSVEAAMEREDLAWVNVTLRAWYVEGGATVGFEIAEQLGWRAPDHVLAPMASGSLVTQLAAAFDGLQRAGLVESAAVRISGAQPSGCAPIANAFAAGDRQVAPVRPATLAASIAMGDPPEGDRVLALARGSGGTVVAVPEDEIDEGVALLLDTEGIAVEPAGGVTIAALRQMAEAGLARRDERIVVVLTGGPAPAGMAIDPGRFTTIDPSLDALRRVVPTDQRNP